MTATAEARPTPERARGGIRSMAVPAPAGKKSKKDVFVMAEFTAGPGGERDGAETGVIYQDPTRARN